MDKKKVLSFIALVIIVILWGVVPVIGKYLLEVISEDDDWEPNGNFVRKCVEECKKRNQVKHTYGNTYNSG